VGDWAQEEATLPPLMRGAVHGANLTLNGRREYALARRAYYALCTHIDHQLRLVLGTLREEGLLDDTVIVFTADHGDMLGDHGMWAKRLYYEASACVPMILCAPRQERVGRNVLDDRLVGHQDIMPTVLDLCGIDVPETVCGLSMVGDRKRETFFGEVDDGPRATRMLHDGRHKLIWYSQGNHLQLFDLEEDPGELANLVDDPAYAAVRDRLVAGLIAELSGGDQTGFVEGGKLKGLPPRDFRPWHSHPGLSGQRGTHFPMPPAKP